MLRLSYILGEREKGHFSTRTGEGLQCAERAAACRVTTSEWIAEHRRSSFFFTRRRHPDKLCMYIWVLLPSSCLVFAIYDVRVILICWLKVFIRVIIYWFPSPLLSSPLLTPLSLPRDCSSIHLFIFIFIYVFYILLSRDDTHAKKNPIGGYIQPRKDRANAGLLTNSENDT